MEYLHGILEKSMKGNGIMGSSMERESLLLDKRNKLDYGKMEKESDGMMKTINKAQKIDTIKILPLFYNEQ